MSPRQKKPRHCRVPCREGKDLIFKPAGIPFDLLEKIVIYRDEFEAVRLCDGECLTQQEAGLNMGVSRGTVQRLAASGRKKIIDAIVCSRALVIKQDEAEAESD